MNLCCHLVLVSLWPGGLVYGFYNPISSAQGSANPKIKSKVENPQTGSKSMLQRFNSPAPCRILFNSIGGKIFKTLLIVLLKFLCKCSPELMLDPTIALPMAE
jgi:hypothetical protein